MARAAAFFLSFLILCSIIWYQVNSSYQLNDHHWVYPLDDTYIHLSIGKNLAEYGQWGITRFEFTSSSSSILYTILMALSIKLFGTSEFIPLVLNIIAGILIFVALWLISEKEKFSPLLCFVLSGALLFFTPLPALIISGMEHTFQVFIDLVFLYLAISNLDKKEKNIVSYSLLIVFALLTVMIRYEGIFLIGVVALYFAVKKDWKTAMLVGFFGFLPIMIFGIYSIKNGAYFIPNSLLMKGEKPSMNLGGLIRFSFGWLDKLKRNAHLLALFLVLCSYAYYLVKERVSFFRKDFALALILILVMIIHLTLAKTGWFFRYEAYLVFLCIFSFSWILQQSLQQSNLLLIARPANIFLLVAGMAMLYPLYSRGKTALVTTVPATKNIYEQQFQMARFLQKFYNKANIGANDIGAICYFTDIKLFDIFGLGSKEIIDLRIKKDFDKAHIYELSKIKKTQIVVIYEDWFIDKVPDQWKKIMSWKIKDNVILGGEVVTFFATENFNGDELQRSLKEFSKTLPKDVEVLP